MPALIKDLLRFVLRMDMAVLAQGAQLAVVIFYWLYLLWRDTQ